MKTGHVAANGDSKEFCDLLFTKLAELIPNLQSSSSKKWCGFFQRDRSRFAYINHRKRLSRIEVWCTGDPKDLQKNNKLHVEVRQPTSGGFGRMFQARFFIDEPSQIDDAVKTLYRVSFPIS